MRIAEGSLERGTFEIGMICFRVQELNGWFRNVNDYRRSKRERLRRAPIIPLRNECLKQSTRVGVTKTSANSKETAWPTSPRSRKP
jgi:hypothetical protein